MSDYNSMMYGGIDTLKGRIPELVRVYKELGLEPHEGLARLEDQWLHTLRFPEPDLESIKDHMMVVWG